MQGYCSSLQSGNQDKKINAKNQSFILSQTANSRLSALQPSYREVQALWAPSHRSDLESKQKEWFTREKLGTLVFSQDNFAAKVAGRGSSGFT